VMSTTRICIRCKKAKELRAFVGGREVCRVCWISVPETDKPRYIMFEIRRRGGFNAPNVIS